MALVTAPDYTAIHGHLAKSSSSLKELLG